MARIDSKVRKALSLKDDTILQLQAKLQQAESKKIGVLRVPQPLIEQMWRGQCVELITPDALRIALLRDEYAHLIASPPLMIEKIDCLTALHSEDRIAAWKAQVGAGDWDGLVADLLANHYDPAYKRSMFRNYVRLADAMPVTLKEYSEQGFSLIARNIISARGS